MKWPIATPIAIARKIQRVRKRSKNESFFRCNGAQISRLAYRVCWTCLSGLDSNVWAINWEPAEGAP